jgi:hypothetical protein
VHGLFGPENCRRSPAPVGWTLREKDSASASALGLLVVDDGSKMGTAWASK